MEVKFFCAWWGLDHLGMATLLTKIKHYGYDGVEIGIPDNSDERKLLRGLLDENELEVIAHQYQASGDTFEEYFRNYTHSLENAASFKPILINSHTGKDYWSYEENGRLLAEGERISAEHGVKIIHETHRGRFLYSTNAAKEYFSRHPALKINFDLSHWCCVSESLLEDQSNIVDEAIERAEHIHARVGHPQGAQVIDPRDPIWKKELDVFTDWWLKIITKREKEGREMFTITPEFGPIPYTIRRPYSNEPINGFFDINLFMKDYLKEKLAALKRLE